MTSAPLPGIPLLSVRGLTVNFGGRARDRADVTPPAVRDVSFDIAPGECLALVGESGSGKSVTARSLLGLAGAGARVQAERLEFEGASLPGLRPAAWRALRGSRIGLVLQDALVSLDPLRPVGREIDDALRLHTTLGAAARRARVIELLDSVGMPEPELRARQRSGELSGGLRQRALIASAIAAGPSLLIADEPTTALDATVQAQILRLLGELTSQGTALLLISHDLAVVGQLADRVAVMRAGQIVEEGPSAQILGDPQHPYTQELLRSVPADVPRGTRLSLAPAPTTPVAPAPIPSATPVLEARGLRREFRRDTHVITAADDVSFRLAAGRTLGLVGESGSGKTTVARLALGLERADAGSVLLEGAEWSTLPERERRGRRGRLGAIYQDTLSSFDPRLTVEAILIDALGGSGRRTPPLSARVDELLDSVGLPRTVRGRRPLHLSGGQRQRVAIARALAPSPRVIICDEPVSALDVSVQAQVLDLLDEVQASLGVAYLFISHDLGVVRHMSDEVAVMRAGRIVEAGTPDQIFGNPQHEYTRALLAAEPRLPARFRYGSGGPTQPTTAG